MERAAEQYVDIHDFADSPLENRWKGVFLSCVVFDKDQRVSHAAIVENKRLGAALAFIKAQRDAEVPAQGSRPATRRWATGERVAKRRLSRLPRRRQND